MKRVDNNILQYLRNIMQDLDKQILINLWAEFAQEKEFSDES